MPPSQLGGIRQHGRFHLCRRRRRVRDLRAGAPAPEELRAWPWILLVRRHRGDRLALHDSRLERVSNHLVVHIRLGLFRCEPGVSQIVGGSMIGEDDGDNYSKSH